MGKHFKYTKEILEDAVSKSFSYSGVIRYLGKEQAGGTQSHIKKMIEKFCIDTSHFTGQAHRKGASSNKKKHFTEYLVMSSRDYRLSQPKLKRAMLEAGFEEICDGCGVGLKYNNKPLVLEIDHIDGNWKNNQRENLRFLCPNCHSQTETYCNKNKRGCGEMADTAGLGPAE